MNDIAIELKGIDKKFGLVHANKNINMKVRKGTIHGIIGENGAGKSTLMSILYGFYQADNGDIFVDGKKTVIKDPNAAISVGIGMVHQHFMLVENFTVLENIMLGAEESQLLNAGITKARRELKQLEEEYELEVDPDAIIEELPVGIQQRVEILKALYPRRRDPDPRRAHRRVDPGRGRSPVPYPQAAQVRRQNHPADHPQAARDHGRDR
jgi:ABC-type uncharacterized transport system ATPase subunit